MIQNRGIKDAYVSALILNRDVISHNLRIGLTLLLLWRYGLYTSAIMLDK